ncbi:MFS transporter [Paenibacillus glycanilyticus]|uniref:MFS transporter n=1 Tax=Paenibacillus glycanilyticus TaxID=126569 RepID=UPI001F2892D6|nr:MFS transporter [Paenibacillus glycanilyticus]
MILRTVIIVVFSFQLILNMTRPIISLYGSNLGASALEIGYLTAAYAFLPLLFSIHAGRAADKMGDKIPVLGGFIGVGLGMAVPYLFDSLWALYVSQVIVGISHIFIVISLQNVIGNSAPADKRDYYFSMFSTAVSLGAVIGPVIGGYVAENLSYQAVFSTSCVVCILAFILSLQLQSTARNRGSANSNLLSSISLLKMLVLRKAMFSSALALYSRDIFMAYFPLYGKHLGLTTSTIGWIIALQGLFMVAVRFSLTRLTNALGRDQILMASIFIAGLSFLLIPMTEHVILLGLWSACMGAGLGCSQPLSMTTTYNASPKSRTGEVLGLRLAVNKASQLVAPLFFGLIGSSLSLLSVFIVSGAFLVGGSWIIRPAKATTTETPMEEMS